MWLSKIHQNLYEIGERCGKKRVTRLMKKAGLKKAQAAIEKHALKLARLLFKPTII